VVTGRFDRAKVARAIETERKGVTSKNVSGTVVYLFDENSAGKGTGATAFLDDNTLVMGTQASVEQTVIARAKGEAPLRDNAPLLALLEGVKPGSTFWMVGDQTLLSNMPKAIPGPGGPGTSQSIELPALKSLTVTGDLEPQVSLDITGEAADEPRVRGPGLAAGEPEAGAQAARVRDQRDHGGLARARRGARALRGAGLAAAQAGRDGTASERAVAQPSVSTRTGPRCGTGGGTCRGPLRSGCP
jgi:hypothetical protein